MGDQDREVVIRISAKNLTDAEIEAAQRRLSGLKDEAGRAGAAGTSMGGAFASAGKMLAGALTVGALINFARGAMDTADSLVNMSDKTDVAIDRLQDLKALTENSGGSLEQLSDLLVVMGKNIADGGQSTRDAVAALGLSLDDLRAQSPDQQLETVAKALAQVEDEGRRNTLGMDVMGRAYKGLIPTIKEAANGIEDVGGASDASTRAFDRAGDTIGQFYERTLKGGLINILGDAVVAIEKTAEGVGHLTKGELHEAILSWSNYNKELPKVADNLRAVARAHAEIALRGEQNPRFARHWLGMDPEEIKRVEDELTAAAQQRMKVNEEAAAHAKAVAEAMKQMWGRDVLDQARVAMDAYIGITRQGLVPTQEEQTKLNDLLTDAIEIYRLQGREVPANLMGIWLATADLTQKSGDLNETLQQVLASGRQLADEKANFDAAFDFIGPLQEIWQPDYFVGPVQQTARATVKTFRETFAEGLGDVVRSIPSVFQQAFTGGGGVLGALKAIGMQLADTIAGSFLDQLAKKLTASIVGKIIGGAVAGGGAGVTLPGVAAPGIEGAAGSAGLGMTVGLGAMAAVGAVFVGGLMGMHAQQKEIEAAFAANRAGYEALVAEGVAYAETVKAEYAELLEAVNTDIPGTADVGAMAKRIPILKEIAKLEGDIAGKEQELAALQASLVPGWEEVQSITQKYGGDVRNLGETFRQMKTNADTSAILTDFERLIAAGADAGSVVNMMGDEIQAVVRESLKLGTAVPANMRPLIEEMIRAGSLTDEAGGKITDLTTIKFGDPVKTEGDKVRDAMREIKDAIREMVEKLGTFVEDVKKIPERTKTQRDEFYGQWRYAPWKDWDLPEVPGGGGSGGRPGGTGGGKGGSNAEGTGLRFYDFGYQSWSRMHGREAVVTERQTPDLAAAIAAHMAPALSRPAQPARPGDVYLDGRRVGQVLLPVIVDALWRQGLVSRG